MSLDSGSTWKLIARVVRPAIAVSPAGGSEKPGVERSSAQGVTISLGAGRAVRVLPDSPTARKSKVGILLNVPNGSAVFKDFGPPSGTQIARRVGRSTLPIDGSYVPADGDVLTADVTQTRLTKEQLERYSADAVVRYREAAFARLRADGREPVSGKLTLSANLASGEKPAAVTFSVDFSINSMMNTGPYKVSINTRELADGDHVVEVRALDRTSAVISSSRRLVVVKNSPQAP